jgi:hypothetical protein
MNETTLDAIDAVYRAGKYLAYADSATSVHALIERKGRITRDDLRRLAANLSARAAANLPR